MSVDNHSATVTRSIRLVSRGVHYDALFITSHGNLLQQYVGSPSAPTEYLPDFTANPETCMLQITSSRVTGVVTPSSVEYYCAGTKLTFNASGACTTAGFTNIFKIVGGNLTVIGNLVSIASGVSFTIQAKAFLSASDPSEYIVVDLPVNISPYVEGQAVKVSIVPGDSNNFTIVDNGGSCTLKAAVFDRKWLTDAELVAAYDFVWEQFISNAWTSKGTQLTYIAKDASVDTYSLFRLTVKKKGTSDVVGQYTQGVMDATDPYDIITTLYRNETGTGTDTQSNDETLYDDLPDAAYIVFVPQMVRRGDTSPISGAKFATGELIDAAGVPVLNVPLISNYSGTNPAYKVTVGNIKSACGCGGYNLVISATL